MNNGEGFEQRWEFRRKEADGDTSSDDNRLNSSADPTDSNHPNLVTDLVLLANDDNDDDKLDTHNSIQSPIVKVDDTKIESSKRKKVVQKKLKKVRENKRKRKVKTDETVLLKELKIFADSLIQELAVAQENMFAHMRKEMRKLVASGPSLEPCKNNVRRSHEKKVNAKNGIETSTVKPIQQESRTNELQLRLPSMVHMNSAYGSDNQVVSLPKPHFEDQRNRFQLYNHIASIVPMKNSGSELEIRRYSRGIAEFQAEERSGSFSQRLIKGSGLVGQNSSRAVGFPVALNQGTDSGSNLSSLTYSENSVMDSNGVGLIGRILRRNIMSSERMVGDSITGKTARKTDGEFVAERLQDLKDGQFYRTSLRNDC